MSNTAATDEETIAARRKRLRRVSFADREITSVHIFNRDEDDDKPQNDEESNNTPESADKAVRFFGELADGDDTEGDCDGEDDVVTEKSFLRPRGSPSSGGSTIGSATSDDDDNFFGPVSSHFINPGRFSDVTASEEHHDITMDSTAFSMHFRSLAMSGDVKTPTSSQLRVDELAQVSDTGSGMALTGPKNFFSEPTLPDDKGSGGCDSNDMSIVGENSRKYDYGRISPRLAALLGEESNELLPASAGNSLNVGLPVHDSSLSPLNRGIPIGAVDKDSQILMQKSGSQHYSKEASPLLSAVERQRASLVGMLPAPQPFSCFTPSPNRGGSFMSRGTLALVESLPTIQKSQSRFGLIASSPGSALSQRIEKSKLQLSRLRSTPSTVGKEEIGAHKLKHADIPITNLEDLLSKYDDRTPVSEVKGTPYQHSSGAFNSAVDFSDVFACTSPEGNINSEVEGSLLRQQQKSQTASTPKKFVSFPANSPIATTSALKSFVTLHDQEQQSETIRTSETEDGNRTGDVFARTSPEGNTNSEIEGSLLKQQQRNEKASTPRKFVSSQANTPNATKSALRSFVTLHDQEQQRETIRSSETGHGNMTSDVFARTNPEGNTNSEIDGSLLNQQQRNQTTSAPQKFVSSPANTPNATKSALRSFVTLHDQEQQRETIRSSETGHGNMTSDVFARTNPEGNTNSEIDGSLLNQQQRNQTTSAPQKFVSSPANTPNAATSALRSFVTLHDQEQQRETIRSSDTGDGNMINNVFARTNPEGNTNSGIEGSLLKQKQRNQTASTPQKFVSSPSNTPNATTSAVKSFVTLHDQEQQSETIRSSETGDVNATSDFASNNSMNTLSDKMDPLLAESGVLLSKTGFLNGYVQQIGKDNTNAAQLLLEDKNQSEVLCATEVISTKDGAAIVTKSLPGTFGSSSMDINKNEASHAEGTSKLKRKAEDVDFFVRNCSPRVGKSTHHISNPVTDNPDESSHANDCSVDIVRKQVMNWIEIPGKISVEMNQMIAPLAEKLNSGLICKLEDILTHFKKVHLCEMLCLQIKSQKVCDKLSAAKAKRRTEARSLLCKLAYEKAKLELLHLKQEIMMKKYQAVSTGVQTSEKLTLDCAKLVRQHGILSTGLLNSEQSQEVTTTKGAELTEEVKMLDSKIKSLIRHFPTSDDMTTEPSYVDTILIAEDDLKKKRSCRFIRQDILVWKVDSLGESNECQSIVLNYSGLINQRLTLKPGRASCVLVSNRLSDNDKFITNFPDMNVSVAFNSLFNADYSEKYASGLLLEITQKTSLLLRNLLDVAEELHLARVEMPNLVQGSFDSPSAEQLHLRISFIDCKSLRKVNMILDVTCLIHGKYPGDIIPRELVEVSGTSRDEGVVSKQLMSEVESVMVDVGFGYPRILRLCNCVSDVLR